VLIPMRRGFVAVEPLLRATYADLAADAQAAVDYLGARPEVDGGALGIIAQADDAPPAMLAAIASTESIPLVLLAPPGFPGREVFRIEQRGIAESMGVRAQDLDALDRYVEELADIVLSDGSPARRTYLLPVLMASSDVRLPYNAAFPNDESQVHFFASPLWHDRMAFDPEAVLARLRSPALVLIGSEDPNTPWDAYLEGMRRGLTASGSPDATVRPIEGRTRHTFSREALTVIAAWLGERVGR
jgi:uncharacterized protein